MEFNVGDQVVIKPDFAQLRYENDPQVDPKMHGFAGSTTVIMKTWNVSPNWYKVENNNFIWDERWLDPVEENIAMTENDILNIFKE